MKIAILGSGIVGRTIASKLNELGHQVVIGTRNVQNTMAKEEQDSYGNPPFHVWKDANEKIGLATFKEAVNDSDLIFNCSNGQASISILEQVGENTLGDRILIDVANPLDFSQGMPPSLTPVNTDSLGEQIQRRFPRLKVVKTLNTMNCQIMVSPSLVKGDHNVFVCGNDEAAKDKVKIVLNAFGWQDEWIIDLGDISNTRGTEMLLPIWLRLWNALGTAEFNFYIQRG